MKTAGSTLDVLIGFAKSELKSEDISALVDVNEAHFRELSDRIYESVLGTIDLLENDGLASDSDEVVVFCPTHSEWYFARSESMTSDYVEGDLKQTLKSLLYFDKLYLEDPLQHFLQNLYSYPVFKEHNQQLSTVLRFLQQIRPLVEADVIRISPLNFAYHPAYGNTIIALDEEGFRDELVTDMVLSLEARWPYYDISRSLVAASVLDAHFLLHHPDSQRLLQVKLDRLDEWLKVYQVQLNHQVSPLLRVDVPRFDELTVSDFVSIRSEELAFEQWRTDLRSMLAELERAHLSQSEYCEVFRHISKREMRAAVLRLDEKIRESSLRRRLQDTGYAFGVGSISAFVVTPELLSSLLTGVVSSATGLLFSLLFRRTSKATLALRKHYGVFSE